jgi:hypothetical protein
MRHDASRSTGNSVRSLFAHIADAIAVRGLARR